MTWTTAEEIEAAAMHLTVSERARLAERLLSSLDEDSEIEQAWAAEIDRRIDEYERGDTKLIPAEEVFDRVRARLGRPTIPIPLVTRD
ncbi:MAG: addiction module protein [Deferrisomatales bacterium]